MGDPMKKKTAMDKPRPIDFNCFTTAAREVRLSRALPLPPPTLLCQMLSCSSRGTTAMASIPSPLLLLEFVREKVRERKKSNQEAGLI
ncbi:uncharacterized protein [Pyrus communis]|uniref:uncharacterized protein isoform X3 n=1 Tax=Pyrus communis TaxID=23211 RepID=UPI0035BFDDA7